MKAISSWAKYLPVPMIEIKDPYLMKQADIRISFASRQHGDNTPFDGPGGYLAHDKGF